MDQAPSPDYGNLLSALGHLWKSVESLKAECHEQSHEMSHTLNTWLDTNQLLLEALLDNARTTQESVKGFETSTTSLVTLQEQLNNSATATKQLVETLSGLTNFHQSIKVSNENFQALNGTLQSVNDKLVKLNRRTLNDSRRSVVNLWVLISIFTIVFAGTIGNVVLLRHSNDRVTTVLDKVQRIEKAVR